MEWLWGAALAPLLLCGLMCGIPMLLVALGWRRGNAERGHGCHSGEVRDEREPVEETSSRS